MEETKVVTKVHSEHVLDWYTDYTINIQHSINGYSKIYRRLFYVKGYCERIVIAFTPQEREIASNALEFKNELDNIKNTTWFKIGRWLKII